MPDTSQIADDARALLEELDRDAPGAAELSAECRPQIDVIETTDATEVLVDVAGVPRTHLRVAIRRNAVIVVGAKVAPAPPRDVRFHLAERTYGRFARVIRVTGAFDANRAKALAHHGLLRIVLPRIEDRRGRLVTVPVEPA